MQRSFLITFVLSISISLFATPYARAQGPKQVVVNCRIIELSKDRTACVDSALGVPDGWVGMGVGDARQNYNRIADQIDEAALGDQTPLEADGLYRMLTLNDVDVSIVASSQWVPVLARRYDAPNGLWWYVAVDADYAGGLLALVERAARAEGQEPISEKPAAAAVTRDMAPVERSDESDVILADLGPIHTMGLTVLSGENIVNSATCRSGASALLVHGQRVARLVLGAAETARYVIVQLTCLGGLQLRR